MNPSPNLDELLCSFVDGELSPHQRTEVERMAVRDPQVGRRLRQLQNCRTLFCSLPQAQAPADLLEQVRQSLERQTLLQERPAFARRSFGAWHLAFRRLVSAAAVVALLGVLGVVVYQIVGPVSPSVTPPRADSEQVPAPVVRPMGAVADAGFSGRLELRTAALVPADASIRRALEDGGLVRSAQVDETAGDRRVYHLVSTREGVNRVIASLSSLWPNFERTVLRVDRLGDAITPVVVESVTPEQAVAIISRDTTEASIRTAEAYALMNSVARNVPGHEVVTAIRDEAGITPGMMAIPMPAQASNDDAMKTTPTVPQGQPEASLTIVLLGTR
jgi:anti-sigma factor RsiW